mmetsp:Transcript_29505/g.83160  ORF Transcript_29505/g.83160 Transcript_29505/m.83160 type:complete len:158 (-) Transcript_29505:11-484(-)
MASLTCLPAELRQSHGSGGEALKVFLAELSYIGHDHEGRFVCTRMRRRLQRIWIQGYVICRDDDVVDVDDGSAVMSLDVGSFLIANPEFGSVLSTGRYVSCVCTVEVHPPGIVDLCVESVCDLDAASDALAEPFWWLEVAEAHRLMESPSGSTGALP